MTASTRPPKVPYRIPVIGHARAMSRDPVGFLRDCQRRHGSVFTVQLPGGPQTILVDPHDYPTYFKEKRLDFRAVGTEMGARWFGYDPAQCRVDIGAMTNKTGRMLGGSELTPLTTVVQRELSDRIGFPANDETLPHDRLLQWLTDLVFGSGIDALFGRGFATPEIREDYQLVDRGLVAVGAGVPKWLVPGFRRGLGRLAGSLARECPQRSHVISSRAEQFEAAGTPEHQRQRMDVAWLWASQVNTIGSAFWTLYYVLGHPAAREALEREAADVVGGRDLAREPLDKAELKTLAKLDSTIMEVMRLTSSSIIIRRAVETFDFETDGGPTFRIEQGELFNVYSGTTHFDPEIFDEPDTFRYDRFLATGSPQVFTKGGRPLQFPLLPFGSGSSMCPGRFFAMNELKVLVACVLSRYELELTDERVPSVDLTRMGLGIPPPTHDVRFRARPRQSGPTQRPLERRSI